MATALDKIAHLILPNIMKLKGASSLVSAIERRDVSAFAHVWQQTGFESHTPQVSAKEKGEWRIGVVAMPAPSEGGEAHMVAFVANKNEQVLPRYFTLEYDFILSKTGKTLLCEVHVKDNKSTVKLGEGPALTGDFQTDSTAFADALMAHVK